MADQKSGKTVLFQQLLEGKLSPGEVEELVQWLGSDNADPEAVELVLQQLKRDDISEEKITSGLIARLEARLPQIVTTTENHPAPVISVFRKRWIRYAVAAAMVLGLGWYLLETYSPSTGEAAQNSVRNTSDDDIQPGKDGAVLTLADGRRIVLDSLGNRLVTTQNGTKVLLQNGQLIYDAGGTATAIAQYNTMTTPKGRQFQLVLPDGSKVWLNAASSIRYPTVFTGNERTVSITGEAYFEVARNVSRPFRVKVNEETEIEVLGTHFNINSYENEESINTTLLEGSVRVRNSSGKVVLKPGQQARTRGSDKINVLENANVEKVMAWKNGVFDFQDATLEEVMRQLERWYDIEVAYEKNIPRLEFFGKMGKDLPLATVLRGLAKSNVHFRLEEGRRLVVLP